MVLLGSLLVALAPEGAILKIREWFFSVAHA